MWRAGKAKKSSSRDGPDSEIFVTATPPRGQSLPAKGTASCWNTIHRERKVLLPAGRPSIVMLSAERACWSAMRFLLAAALAAAVEFPEEEKLVAKGKVAIVRAPRSR